MKTLIGIVAVAYLTGGCVSYSTIPHEDSPAAVKRDDGPALCLDGTVPPCVARD